MTDESLYVEDASGCVIKEMVMVNGLPMPTFGKPVDEAAAIIRNVRNIRIRDDDVMLCTYPKSGTHWGYEIISMLLNRKVEISSEMKASVMLELLPETELEKLLSPRVLNSHMPLEWLPKQLKNKKTKTVVIVRNPKDVAVSYYYHVCGLRMFDYDGKFTDLLKLFMEGKLMYGSWYQYTLDFEKAVLSEPDRFHLMYFEDMKENGFEEIKKLANFLEIQADDDLIMAINEKCSFRSLAVKETPEDLKKRKRKNNFSFFRKGEIGDWKNHFTVAESEAFDKVFKEEMKTSTIKLKFEPSKL